MKFKFVKDSDEFVEVHAEEKTDLVNQIEELVSNDSNINGVNINGYLENDIVPIKLKEIYSFYALDNKTFVRLENKEYQVKFRLYQLEEKLPSNFIKINKSRIINRDFIGKFDVSWSGTLLVEMKNNDKDYVSRRLIKQVKERMDIK